MIVETPTDYLTLCLSRLTSKTFIPKRTHETSTKKKQRQQESEAIRLLVERLSLSCVFRSVSANYDRDCSQRLPVQCITGSYINTWMKREKAKQHFQGIKATSRHSNLQKGVFAPPSLFRVTSREILSGHWKNCEAEAILHLTQFIDKVKCYILDKYYKMCMLHRQYETDFK